VLAILSFIALLILTTCASRADVDIPTLDPEAQSTLDQLEGTADGEQTEEVIDITPEQDMLTEEALPTSIPSPTALPRVGPYVYPEGVNPLTGLTVADPALLERRPLMIKVSNFPVSGRPHAGLSYADMVFEYYIGTGSTRFIALYYGEDSPRVGPIRSGRIADAQLVRLYGGVLGMMRASGEVWDYLIDTLGDRVLSASPRYCPALCVENSTVTGVYADSAALSELVESKGVDNARPQLDGMLFDVALPPDGERGDRLWMYYASLNQAAWEYDPDRGVYLRLQDNADSVLRPMPDRITGEQLAFENVVVMFVVTDVERKTLITLNFWGVEDGNALIFRDGQAYWTTFSAPSTDQPLRFYDAAHTPFAFKAGQTWFEIVSVESPVTEIEEGSWKVRHWIRPDD
jgi:hypothetical protein